MVQRHLATCLPERSDEERQQIEHDFYHYLCDYFVETIKLTSMSEQEMRHRMTFDGMELIHDTAAQGRSVSLLLGHFCNWEWITAIGLFLPEGTLGGQVYHQLESPAADRLFLRIRERMHTQCITIEDTPATLLNAYKEGKVSIVGYIADQSPGFSSMHYWHDFLHHMTPFYSGCERISRMIDARVFYVDIYRERRGYYHARFIPVADDLRSTPTFGITKRYAELLEGSIQRTPAYWLWSHNRWKRTWEDFCQTYPDEKERKRIMSKL